MGKTILSASAKIKSQKNVSNLKTIIWVLKMFICNRNPSSTALSAAKL